MLDLRRVTYKLYHVIPNNFATFLDLWDPVRIRAFWALFVDPSNTRHNGGWNPTGMHPPLWDRIDINLGFLGLLATGWLVKNPNWWFEHVLTRKWSTITHPWHQAPPAPAAWAASAARRKRAVGSKGFLESRHLNMAGMQPGWPQ